MVRLAECHPQRKNKARGLCGPCYDQWLKKSNPSYANRQKLAKSAWWDKSPEYRAIANAKRKLRGRTYKEQRTTVLRQYGLTIQDYETLLIKQNYACALCYRKQGKRHLHVDHNHETNKVRGLLCHQCNWYLGTIDNDPTIIDRIKSYRDQT